MSLRSIKDRIKKLIEDNYNIEAIGLLEKVMDNGNKDNEIINMYIVALANLDRYNEAIKFIISETILYEEDYELLYNIAYLYEALSKIDHAQYYYKLSAINCDNEEMLSVIKLADNRLEGSRILQRIVFFVKEGMDSFLDDIIKGLAEEYIVNKCIVKSYSDIDAGMREADICWFEWCDELAIYGSNSEFAENKKIICRLHRYEAFSEHILKVKWDNIDKVIFVSDHIKETVLKHVNIEEEKIEKVYNGVNLEKFTCKNRKPGFNLACIGYLNLRKNPMMVIHLFNEIVKHDKRYKLFFAGNFQDKMLEEYIFNIIKRLGLENNIIFDGYVNNDNIQEWLSDKNYIVTGSIGEGHPVGVMEAMKCGLKPCIHYFPGIESMYPNKYIWNTYEDAIKLVLDENYNSEEYSSFITENYSLSKQIGEIKEVIIDMLKRDESRIIGISNKDIDKYIYGEKFSSGYKIYLENNNTNVIDRMSYIVEKCSKEKVIHLGCADHLELIDNKRNNGLWLHDKITERASECIGFDINEKAIKYINEELKITNVFYDDIISEKNKKICENKWDMIIIGEILEHVNNPIDFLTNIRKMYSGVIEKVLITVPNALKLENYFFADKGFECINTDHKYWFTPYTVSKVMNEAGIEVEEIFMAPGYEVVDDEMREILKNNNLLMDTIVIIGKL